MQIYGINKGSDIFVGGSEHKVWEREGLEITVRAEVRLISERLSHLRDIDLIL